ncbi:MAG TPA: hypothetical protein VKZ63_18145 [Kofleriaceae bacterium]|nr:hypothetical protein [Kofleriaceae bacterium]
MARPLTSPPAGLGARRVALFLLAAAAACGRSDGGRPDAELGGLVHAPDTSPAEIDVARAAKEPAELLRAAALTHAQLSALLGPHQVSGRSHLEVREGNELVESLDEDLSIQLDADGNYHAVSSNSQDYGRDVYFVDGALYLRPRYGKFHRRQPNQSTEPDRIRSEMFGSAAAHLELLAPGLAVADGGTVEVASRPARLVKLSTGKVADPPPQRTTQRQWRESAVVKEVSGEIALDEKTGAPLRARVQGAVTFQRDGRSFEMRLEAEHELSAFGAVAAVAAPAPDQVVAGIEQRHELAERESLLEGIAPPARRAAGP